MKLERVILANLIEVDAFRKRSLPFLKVEYFTEVNQQRIYKILFDFLQKYNTKPTKSALSILIDQLPLSEDDNKATQKELDDILSHNCTESLDWLLDETEKFCKDKALFNAISESIEIISDTPKKNKKSKDCLPELLRNALSVGFDIRVGHEYFGDSKERYAMYNNKETHIPFDIEYLNKITDGGVTPKTLNVVMAPPGGGKSIFLCHTAAAYLKQNKNVLYITCEMSETRIAERIDANLMDITISDVKLLTEKSFEIKVERLRKTTTGNLIIKEYPTATLNSLHIQVLLDELKSKKNFVPDAIFIDYLNICTSTKYTASSGANSYTIIKSISEEFRALGVINKVPIWTATQFNRSGVDNSDPNMTNIAESMGTAHTADLMIAIISTDELDSLGQVMIKQIKNRYNDVAAHKKFIVGLDKPKMKFYDVNDKAQNILDNNSGAVSTTSNSKTKTTKNYEDWV